MSKHTPGPWRVGDAGNTIFGAPNGNPSPKTIALARPLTNGENRANARLIAAAPDLLAALEETRDFLMGGDSLESADPWVRELITDTIDPAIAKARGEAR